MTHLRAAVEADAERATELVIAVDIAEVGEADYDLGALRDEWSELELALDAVVAEDQDGTAIGYAHFRRNHVLAAVDPARHGEGAGTLLLEWAQKRGKERGHATLRQELGTNPDGRALLERHGWQQVRSYWRMETEAAGEPGFRALRPDDAPALYAIHEAAFATVPDHVAHSEEAWTRQFFGASDLDLELSRVAEGRGFALTRRWEDGTAYIAPLAVHPDAAGQGLGSALLKAVFAAAPGKVVLNVASDNPSAVRLYERVGMTVRWRLDAFEWPVPD